MLERRSGVDHRSDEEKQRVGERRSGTDRRAPRGSQPPNDQLALFAKRVRRILRDEAARHLFGTAVGEGQYTIFPDVARAIEWIEQLAGQMDPSEPAQKPTLRRAGAALADSAG
jgi:hypothetical protein